MFSWVDSILGITDAPSSPRAREGEGTVLEALHIAPQSPVRQRSADGGGESEKASMVEEVKIEAVPEEAKVQAEILEEDVIEEVVSEPCLPVRNLDADVEKMKKEVVLLRRYFHQNPEVSLQEYLTSQYIKTYLEELGLEVKMCTETGVIGILRGTAESDSDAPEKCIMLRADEDALTVSETNDFEYKSCVPGVMHACGHDAHMAMLLIAAKILSQSTDTFRGIVKFCFQPGEESHGGAFKMIDDGLLENPHVDEVYGCHIWSEAPAGLAFAATGPVMAGSQNFHITVTGKGGHAGLPHTTVDSIVVASHLVVALQTIVSRSVNPRDACVVSIGVFEGGTRHNIISEVTKLKGTIRTFDPDLRENVMERIQAISDGIATAFNAKIDIWFNPMHYPPVVNNSEECFEAIKESISMVNERMFQKWEPINAAEDFSAYLLQRPGCFWFLGGAVKGRPLVGHHKPDFDIDEDSLITGVQIWVNLVKTQLGVKKVAND